MIDALAAFAATYRDLPCLGFTHLQPAQPTTVGKRACLWAHDFALDLAEIEHRIDALRALGNKGTTGTQASFLELFHGDHEKVRRLEELVCRKIGFDAAYPSPARRIRGRSTRRCSASSRASPKARTRWPPTCGCWPIARRSKSRSRADQIGSSAMAYKRNPDAERSGSARWRGS